MNIKKTVFIVSIISILFGCSHHGVNNKSTYSAKELKKDLQVLRDVLEESHHGLYMYTRKESFNAVFDSLQNVITDSMSVTDFYRLIALSLTDKIQCGHTGIFPPQGKSTKLIPLDVYIVCDEIYVNHIYGSKTDPQVVQKLKSINGIETKSLLKTLRKGIPSDGNNKNFKDRIMEVDFPMYFAYLVEEADTYKIEVLETNTAKDTTIVVDAVNWERLNEARSKYPLKRDNKLELKIIDSLSTAYLKIGSFEGWRLKQQGFDFYPYISQTFDSINKLGNKNLIIDLRWNMGGDTDKGANLLTYLYNEPFQMYYKVTASSNHYKHLKYTDKNWKWNFDIGHDHKKDEKGEFITTGMDGKFLPQQELFKGKVYFLINGSSHSTSSTVAALAKYFEAGELVGETPSGAYPGYNGGNWIGLTLPNTKIYASIPIRSFHNAIDSSFYNTNFIQPDYIVNYTIEDKIKGNDLELEKAFERIRLSNNN